MKLIKKDVKPLIVRQIDEKELENYSVIDYTDNAKIVNVDDSLYMVLKRNFVNETNRNIRTIHLENATCKLKNCFDVETEDYELNVKYGDKEAIIVDMHGIDNFRFAKHLVFEDATVRKIILKLGLLNKKDNYLRIGCSGARECSFHPGGEVLECSELRGQNLGGMSQSISGYLPQNEEYSKAVPLEDEDKVHLREERIVYLHAAFLKKTPKRYNSNIFIEINANAENVSLLDITSSVAKKLGINSYAIQIYIENKDDVAGSTKINGRVLRHMPEKPFEVLQDATDIGLEQLFDIKGDAKVYGFGSYYNRYEPEWAEFTGGRRYERRGHIHTTVIDNAKDNKAHEVFHLRDAFISKSSKVHVVLTPVDTTYKIYPIYEKDGKYFIKVTDKNIDEIIAGTIKEDKKVDNNI